MSKESEIPPGPQTIAVHTSKSLNSTAAVSPPIWQTTTFSAETAEDFAEIAIATKPAEFYTRYGNPTVQAVEENRALGRLEEAGQEFDQCRLPRTELAGDCDDVAGRQACGHARRERFGLLGRACLDLGQNSPS